jgi:hypothetical protein
VTPKKETVTRPLRRSEFEIIFGTSNARKGWTDVLAVQRNTVVQAWERLTLDPQANDSTCHGMKGDLEFVSHKGATHMRRQYELSNGARISFYIEGKTVVLFDVHTHHPNATK